MLGCILDKGFSHVRSLDFQEELGTPALAFVRAVCDALRLDVAVEEEVAELRHNLLRLTHTREFAPAAAFKVRASAASLPASCSGPQACRTPDLCLPGACGMREALVRHSKDLKSRTCQNGAAYCRSHLLCSCAGALPLLRAAGRHLHVLQPLHRPGPVQRPGPPGRAPVMMA